MPSKYCVWARRGWVADSAMCVYSLLPKEPLKRANIRFAIEYFSSKINTEFYKYVFNQSAENARENFETNVNAALIRVSTEITRETCCYWHLVYACSSMSSCSNNPRLDLTSLARHILWLMLLLLPLSCVSMHFSNTSWADTSLKPSKITPDFTNLLLALFKDLLLKRPGLATKSSSTPWAPASTSRNKQHLRSRMW